MSRRRRTAGRGGGGRAGAAGVLRRVRRGRAGEAPRGARRCPSTPSALDARRPVGGRGRSPRSLRLGLVQHPAFVPIERARAARRSARPEAWGEDVVQQAARTTPRGRRRSSGASTRTGDDLVIQPRAARGRRRRDARRSSLEPVTVPEASCSPRLATLPVALRAHAEGVAHRRRDRAASRRPRGRRAVVRAFELYARAHMALARGGQEAQRERGRPALARHRGPIASFVVGPVHAGHRAPDARQPLEGRRAVPGRARSSTRPIPSRTRRSATSSWPRRAGSSTRRSRPTTRRSSFARSTRTPTSDSATPARPRATSTAPSRPTSKALVVQPDQSARPPEPRQDLLRARRASTTSR